MRGISDRSFWPSYSDFLTSLFFLALVLFAVSYGALKLTKEQQREVSKVSKAIAGLDTTGGFFKYDPIYKKHILNIVVQFEAESSNVANLPELTQDSLLVAGRKIEQLLKGFPPSEDIRYLVVIEGQASQDRRLTLYDNDALSFRRALGLRRFWESQGIRIAEMPNCEMIVAGSGIGGVPRYKPDYDPRNRRFLIHIIPKPGRNLL